MIVTITIILSILVLINLLLLTFSCNKTTKKDIVKEKPVVIKVDSRIKETSDQLAPTGS